MIPNEPMNRARVNGGVVIVRISAVLILALCLTCILILGIDSDNMRAAAQSYLPPLKNEVSLTPNHSDAIRLDYGPNITFTPVATIYLPVILNNFACTTAPVLISPANNSTVNTLIPIFVFDAGNILSPTKSIYQVGTTPAFTRVIRSGTSGRGGVIHVQEFKNFSPATTYYWRTYLKCGTAQSPFSEVWSFISGSGGIILSPPALVAPENGSTTSTTMVSLQWSPVSGAKLYLFEYQRTDWIGPAGGVTTDEQATIGSLDSGMYVWWVSAVNDYAVGNRSTAWQFTTP